MGTEYRDKETNALLFKQGPEESEAIRKMREHKEMKNEIQELKKQIEELKSIINNKER
jgi:hypothetical protein